MCKPGETILPRFLYVQDVQCTNEQKSVSMTVGDTVGESMTRLETGIKTSRCGTKGEVRDYIYENQWGSVLERIPVRFSGGSVKNFRKRAGMPEKKL